MAKLEVDEVKGADGQECYQVHLTGFGHSGRAVQFRELSEDKIEDIERRAAEIAGPDSDMRELQRTIQRIGACTFVIAITEHSIMPALPPGAKQDTSGPRYPDCSGTKWVKMTFQLMENRGGNRLKAKDLSALDQLYMHLHTVTMGEVQDLMGKVQPVSMV